MHHITPELHQAQVKNTVAKAKEFDYDYETLKTLQHLEIRQFEEKSQLAEDMYELHAEFNDKRAELDNNIQSVCRELSKKLEEAKITLRRSELGLERAQMAMDHHLDSKAKILDDLSDEFEERERKLYEDYEACRAITLKEIQAIENLEK